MQRGRQKKSRTRMAFAAPPPWSEWVGSALKVILACRLGNLIGLDKQVRVGEAFGRWFIWEVPISWCCDYWISMFWIITKKWDTSYIGPLGRAITAPDPLKKKKSLYLHSGESFKPLVPNILGHGTFYSQEMSVTPCPK